MSKYYAVVRSNDELAHYGIRGMKWGVRKAIHKGTEKALSRQYKKAQKKLDSYKKKLDMDYQKNEVAYHTKKAVRSGAVGAGLSAAGHYGAFGKHNLGTYSFYKDGVEHISYLYDKGIKHPGYAVPSVLSMIGGGAALGKSAYHAGKAIAAKYRTTEKGKKRNLAKYNKFKSAMNETFKGTSYDASGSRKRKTSSRKA